MFIDNAYLLSDPKWDGGKQIKYENHLMKLENAFCNSFLAINTEDDALKHWNRNKNESIILDC